VDGIYGRDALKPPEIVLYFNHQLFPIDPSDLLPRKGRGRVPIFVYTFPKQSAP
jgi:hypothetical protein